MVAKPKVFIRIDYRKRALEKYQNLAKFATDLEHFLEEFDSIVGKQRVPPQRYHRLFNDIGETVKKLLAKYESISQYSCWNQKYEELFCCSQLFVDFDEFREHYLKCHYTPRIVDDKVIQLQSARTKLEIMRVLLEEYLRVGSEYTAVIDVNLRKLLAKVSRTYGLVDESE
ncbi:uncharacterized protein LOC129730719 [Wyeomyia smithii]|uniref:uncharacterized protein LOC129730719 n=1 Tax=Wyeomyia smithii TaxID=174621 RepID=UPI002467D44B|nr:uncharacterized protein LOC129730719 [Wyeomyia smithii]